MASCGRRAASANGKRENRTACIAVNKWHCAPRVVNSVLNTTTRDGRKVGHGPCARKALKAATTSLARGSLARMKRVFLRLAAFAR